MAKLISSIDLRFVDVLTTSFKILFRNLILFLIILIITYFVFNPIVLGYIELAEELASSHLPTLNINDLFSLIIQLQLPTDLESKQLNMENLANLISLSFLIPILTAKLTYASYRGGAVRFPLRPFLQGVFNSDVVYNTLITFTIVVFIHVPFFVIAVFVSLVILLLFMKAIQQYWN